MLFTLGGFVKSHKIYECSTVRLGYISTKESGRRKVTSFVCCDNYLKGPRLGRGKVKSNNLDDFVLGILIGLD